MKTVTDPITGIKIVSNHLIPFSGYSAITFFGRVYMRKTKEWIENWLATSPTAKRTMNHERIHFLQKNTMWTKTWVVYYALYIWYWLKLFICTLNNTMAYKTNPMELEAYVNQDDYSYSMSKWHDYVYSNKVRKKIFKERYEPWKEDRKDL